MEYDRLDVTTFDSNDVLDQSLLDIQFYIKAKTKTLFDQYLLIAMGNYPDEIITAAKEQQQFVEMTVSQPFLSLVQTLDEKLHQMLGNHLQRQLEERLRRQEEEKEEARRLAMENARIESMAASDSDRMDIDDMSELSDHDDEKPVAKSSTKLSAKALSVQQQKENARAFALKNGWIDSNKKAGKKITSTSKRGKAMAAMKKSERATMERQNAKEWAARELGMQDFPDTDENSAENSI